MPVCRAVWLVHAKSANCYNVPLESVEANKDAALVLVELKRAGWGVTLDVSAAPTTNKIVIEWERD